MKSYIFEDDDYQLERLRASIEHENMILESLESIKNQIPTNPILTSVSPEPPALVCSDEMSSRSTSTSSASPDLLAAAPDIDQLCRRSSIAVFNSVDLKHLSGGAQGNYNFLSVKGAIRRIKELEGTVEALRRDLTLQTLKAKEERRTKDAVNTKYDTFSEQVEQIRNEHDNFTMKLSKRDQKIEELERKLAYETSERTILEEEVKALRTRVVELELETARQREATLHLENSYEVLVTSNRQTTASLRTELDRIRFDLGKVEKVRRKDLSEIKRTETLLKEMEQQKQHMAEIQQQYEQVANQQKQSMALDLRRVRASVDKNMKMDEKLVEDTKRGLEKIAWIEQNAKLE
ncbi:uncharacterized protein V1516DRAFT_675711 [Lipomyces oligophaga]|uniref:uncharacterized protein n=1 Tax=Lipomyces oligophaga TaxID=45792 RepID=UPI0034CE367B